MKLWHWSDGRRETGYRKLLLATASLPPFDLYLLHYPTDSEVRWHRDPAPAKRAHFRINYVLKRAPLGGHLLLDSPAIFSRGRLTVFCSDGQRHRVTRILAGDRWVLSLGFLLPRRAAEIAIRLGAVARGRS
jgi:hypothetical protein